jgi:hypothetical protein
LVFSLQEWLVFPQAIDCAMLNSLKTFSAIGAGSGVLMCQLLRRSAALFLLGFGLSAFTAELLFLPKAVTVTDNVYAIVGPLGQRSEANAGLNANHGQLACFKRLK